MNPKPITPPHIREKKYGTMRQPSYDCRSKILRRQRDEEEKRKEKHQPDPEPWYEGSHLAARQKMALLKGSPVLSKEQRDEERRAEREQRRQQREKKKEERADDGGGGGKGRGRGKGKGKGNKSRSRSTRDIRDFAAGGGESKTASAMRGAPGPKAPYTGGFKALDPTPKPPATQPSPLPRDKVKAFNIRHTEASKAAAEKKAEEERAAAAARKREEEEEKRRKEKSERDAKKNAGKSAGGARGGSGAASERRDCGEKNPVSKPPPGGRAHVSSAQSITSLFRPSLPISPGGTGSAQGGGPPRAPPPADSFPGLPNPKPSAAGVPALGGTRAGDAPLPQQQPPQIPPPGAGAGNGQRRPQQYHFQSDRRGASVPHVIFDPRVADSGQSSGGGAGNPVQQQRRGSGGAGAALTLPPSLIPHGGWPLSGPGHSPRRLSRSGTAATAADPGGDRAAATAAAGVRQRVSQPAGQTPSPDQADWIGAGSGQGAEMRLVFGAFLRHRIRSHLRQVPYPRTHPPLREGADPSCGRTRLPAEAAPVHPLPG